MANVSFRMTACSDRSGSSTARSRARARLSRHRPSPWPDQAGWECRRVASGSWAVREQPGRVGGDVAAQHEDNRAGRNEGERPDVRCRARELAPAHTIERVNPPQNSATTNAPTRTLRGLHYIEMPNGTRGSERHVSLSGSYTTYLVLVVPGDQLMAIPRRGRCLGSTVRRSVAFARYRSRGRTRLQLRSAWPTHCWPWLSVAPNTIISRPVHTATPSLSSIGASAIRRHVSVAGRYAAPSRGVAPRADRSTPHD